jgi:hypothetical protein
MTKIQLGFGTTFFEINNPKRNHQLQTLSLSLSLSRKSFPVLPSYEELVLFVVRLKMHH